MIKVWDYLREYEARREQILAAVDETFRSGRLILGAKVSELEATFAAYCGVAQPGAGVNSGTDAIFLALKALGVESGDEVITVSNTAIPTVAAIVSAGAIPRFVDIHPDTQLMNTELLEGAITKRTKVLLPVHLYGQCVDMERVTEVAERHGLRVLEDCAQSTGATRHGLRCGALGDAAAFSFYPTKLLGTYGDGGMVVARSSEIIQRIKSLRMYGSKGVYYAEEHGYNSRLDEVHAAILLRKMDWLEEDLARRRVIAARYDRELAGTPLLLPRVLPGNEHAYYIYVVRHPARDRLLEELKQRDIVLNVSYPYPIHTMRAYRHLSNAAEGDLPHTERAAAEVFSLPMYATLTDAEQTEVISTLREILAVVSR
jgi:dTDP-3-amino-2,3,6-trideoxy-4-keto-D-glucose/dTDP-3-amino-3,4,6-trideoxy-alpha-D-glucose/dTDP-2,6-dideoxy-D-kanosamine transaminase